MAESNSRQLIRPTDWLILVFVLVVMGMLIIDLGGNVMETVDRDKEAHPVKTSPPDVT
jgi:hypothetical protein